jgi:hypothetical protein
MLAIQEIALIIMAVESYNEYSFYKMPSITYMTLRYIIVVAIYILFSKDWKAISQMFFLRRLYFGNGGSVTHIYFRAILVIINEVLMFAIVVCCNIGEERGINLALLLNREIPVGKMSGWLPKREVGSFGMWPWSA